MSGEWCLACGTKHPPSPRECPGELRATGHERHGWRVNVDTEHGIEAFGVLVAPAGEAWRARILTYPNVLWAVPGGHASLKFVGDTAAAAERAAIEYVRAHCRARGFDIRDAGVVPVGDFDPEKRSGPEADGPAPRVPRFLPIRFGVVAPSETAGTGNLSETGLFIITNTPPETGARLEMLLLEKGDAFSLSGDVVWRSERPRAGRSPGMGVQLSSPPEKYVSYVRALA